MKTKSIKTLVNEMELRNKIEYYEYLVECLENGNYSSCKALFAEMRKADRIDFIKWSAYREELKKAWNFYVNLI